MGIDLMLLEAMEEIANAERSSDVPLGTAAWHQVWHAPPFSFGDFWLGRLPGGEPFGLRDDRHVLIASGSRAGKGASVIIPNLSLWPGSVVVIDPKGENAMVTARRRHLGSWYCHGMGQAVRILDPFNTVSTPYDSFSDLKAAFNPLDLIDPAKEESVDDAARIAEALIVSENAKEPFWDDAAKALLKALILHVASCDDYDPEQRNLVTVRRLLMAGDAETRAVLRMQADDGEVPPGLFLLFEGMQRNPAFGGVVANAGERFAHMETASPRMLASILQVACTNTDFIDSPAMQRCLARSDFTLEALKTDQRGQSLYVCLPQRFMETHFRWLRMMTTLVVTEMERVERLPASGCPVLMVLDEFASLRRMRVIENAAAQIAGFGVKLMFVVQTLAQLKDIYQDNWETLVANAGVKLFFGNDDNFTRDYVSRLVGECEVTRTSRSSSRTFGESASESRSETAGTSSSLGHSSSYGRNYGGTSSGFNSSAGSSSSFTTSSSSTYGRTTSTNHSQTDGIAESVHKRSLVTPDEVGRLFGDRSNPTALALVSGWQPLFLHRIFYFADESFAGLFDVHRDHPLPPTLKELERLRLEEERQLREAERLSHEAALQETIEAVKAQERAKRVKRMRRRIRIGLIALALVSLIEALSIWYLHATFGCRLECLLIPLALIELP